MGEALSAAAMPALCAGVQMRSRLEARWGRFFTAMGWPWLYEPLDLGGYIPDFSLQLEPQILAEIKPALSIAELCGYTEKVDRLVKDGEFIIFGAGPICDTIDWNPLAGIIRERGDSGEWAWGPARFFQCAICGRPSFCADDGGWRCRTRGCFTRRCDLRDIREHVASQWAFACNDTQWRAPGARQ